MGIFKREVKLSTISGLCTGYDEFYWDKDLVTSFLVFVYNFSTLSISLKLP